jgi:hypothetical protein
MQAPTKGVSTWHTRSLLAIDLERLVHDTISKFYSTHASCNAYGLHRLTWFSSTGDLPSMIYNFVRTHDCFRDSKPSVDADISYTRADDGLNVAAEILWQRPYNHFSEVADSLKPGCDYVIKPEHVPVIGSASGFPQFPEENEFTVRSDDLRMMWDPERSCFSAIVPTDGSGDTVQSVGSHDLLYVLYGIYQNPKSVETTFTSKNVLLFPGHVRHERISRYSIRLDICDSQLPQRMVHTPMSCDFKPFTTRSKSSKSASKGSASSFQDNRCPNRKSTGENDASLVFRKSETFQSARLALDPFEHVELELGTTPRIFPNRPGSGPCTDTDWVDNDEDRVEESWYHQHFSGLVDSATIFLGEAVRNASPVVNIPSWGKELNDSGCGAARNRSRAYKAKHANAKVMPSLRKRGSVKRIVFHRHKRIDSPQEYPTPEDSCSSVPPESDGGLSEREIRSNYMEFLSAIYMRGNPRNFDSIETRREKEDSEERKAIESAFLEDSQAEEWATLSTESLLETSMVQEEM